MYEDQTVDVIRDRILNNTNINIYKGEGSFLYNSASAMAIVLQDIYMYLSALPETFLISKNSGEMLDERLKEFNEFRKEGIASKGFVTVKGANGTLLGNGEILVCNGIRFRIIDGVVIENNTAIVGLEAVDVGVSGNVVAGSTFEFETSISGVESVINESDFSGGVDEETDDEFKERFLYFRRNKATSGNATHYEMWATEVAGITRARVKENWNGAGTVKVIVYAGDNETVDEKRLQAVRDHIQEERPLCPDVTVVTAEKIGIDIVATITVTDEHDLEFINDEFSNKLYTYFITSNNLITYSKIFGCLASCEFVIDVVDMTVNGSKSNITFNDEQIPSLSSVNIKVGA